MRSSSSTLAGVCALAVALAGGGGPPTIGERAKETVAELAALGPRPAGSATERRAGRAVAARLRSLGWRVWIQPVPLPRGGRSLNVVAPGTGSPRALVVAHLDGVSAGPAANDNASGVAVLVELARALRDTPGVRLAALGAEERVETGSSLHLGSARLLASLSRAERRSIRLALSLDMVGYGPTLNVRGLEPRPNAAARLALARSRALRLGATYRQDSGQSDHAELSRAGIPAAWIQWRWDPCWHEACDTAARVKAWKLGAAARLALATVRAALRTSDTQSRYIGHMTELDLFAREVAVTGRTLRRAAARGLVRSERPSARKLFLPASERAYLRRHWTLLAGLVRVLRTQPNVRLAVLFGSLARGEGRAESDLDILVHLRDDDYLVRADLIDRLAATSGRSVQLVSLDQTEEAPLLFADILRDGRVLVDRDRDWPRLKHRERAIARRAREEDERFERAAWATVDSLGRST